MKCCFCKVLLKDEGNNPYPVRTKGRCCDSCNNTIVIPERVYRYVKGKYKL